VLESVDQEPHATLRYSVRCAQRSVSNFIVDQKSLSELSPGTSHYELRVKESSPCSSEDSAEVGEVTLEQTFGEIRPFAGNEEHSYGHGRELRKLEGARIAPTRQSRWGSSGR